MKILTHFLSIFGTNIITSKQLKQNFKHEILVLFTLAGIVIFPRLILPPCLCSTSRISLKEKSNSFIKTRLCAKPLMNMKISLIFFLGGGGSRIDAKGLSLYQNWRWLKCTHYIVSDEKRIFVLWSKHTEIKQTKLAVLTASPPLSLASWSDNE